MMQVVNISNPITQQTQKETIKDINDMCSVCTEPFTTVLRKPIICPSCQYKSCRTCIERYFSTSMFDFQCMNCHRLFDDEFVKSNLTQAGVKRMQRHREDILFERQKTMCPQTQVFVKHAINIEKRDEIRLKINTLHRVEAASKSILHHCKSEESLKIHISNLSDLSRTFKNQITELRTSIDQLNVELRNYEHNKKEKQTKITFSLPCVRENCKGFVTPENKWQCGICDCILCKHCHMELSEGHQCDPNDVESATYIKQSSRSCPSCSTLIHKISGCNQMWCTQCNTAFCYRTGEVFTRNIHNPHYFEWLNRHNPNNQNMEHYNHNDHNFMCNENIAQYRLITHINGILRNDNPHRSSLNEEVRLKYHAQAESRRYREGEYNPETSTRDLRIKWMRGLIDDVKFKRTVQAQEKRWNINNRIYEVYEMYNTMSNELFLRIIKSQNSESIEKMYKELRELRLYANTCFQKIGLLYKNVYPVI